nr:MAG TPA: hypothetical protein [Caudoviricetes sp.]
MHTYTHTYTCTHSHTRTHTKLHNVYNTTLLPLAHHHSNVLHYARICALCKRYSKSDTLHTNKT